MKEEDAVVAGGLKLQVLLMRLMGGMASEPDTVGEVLPPLLKISVSLIVARDRGERTTDPGVMLGSSSILFI